MAQKLTIIGSFNDTIITHSANNGNVKQTLKVFKQQSAVNNLQLLGLGLGMAEVDH